MLDKIVGVTVTEGDDSNLEISVKHDVEVTPWQCPGTTVKGGVIFANMKRPVEKPTPITLRYVVSYDDSIGVRVTSNHTRTLVLEPTRAPQK